MEPDDGAATRTQLAIERTTLAWWRTALASIAVALGVGRVLPELNPDATNWPYVVLGLGFAAYAIWLFAYGTRRGTPEDPGLARQLRRIAAGGIVLALATAVLIALG